MRQMEAGYEQMSMETCEHLQNADAADSQTTAGAGGGAAGAGV